MAKDMTYCYPDAGLRKEFSLSLKKSQHVAFLWTKALRGRHGFLITNNEYTNNASVFTIPFSPSTAATAENPVDINCKRYENGMGSVGFI